MIFESASTKFDLEDPGVFKEQPVFNIIKPNKKRAEIAQLFIWAIMGIEVLSIGSSYLQILLLESMQNSEEVTDLMITSNDTREQWIGISYTVLFVISTFTFIQWFRRAYYNLSLRTSINHDEGWAAGAWFVPLINLFRPYRIMQELSAKTTHLIAIKTSDFTKNNSTFIGAWWTLWIIGNYVGKLLTRGARNADTIEDLLYSTKIDLVLSAFMIPLSIVTVMMIKSYSEKEEKLSELESSPNYTDGIPIIT